jgi:hypothetical protein
MTQEEWWNKRVDVACEVVRRHREGQMSDEVWELLRASIDRNILAAGADRYMALRGWVNGLFNGR